jgi:hypothetical protein
MRYKLTDLRWQIALSAAITAMIWAGLWQAKGTSADLGVLDRATFVTTVAAVASILALFCSVSTAFVLFVSQANRAERVASYDQLKARLLATQQWLSTLPNSAGRETCMALVFELDKADISDLPRVGPEQEYLDYTEALQSGLDSGDPKVRKFFLTSVLYIGYIEQLLNRIGIIAIRQIITKGFIDTLAKGVALICGSVALMVAAAVCFTSANNLAFVAASVFLGCCCMFLFYEFCHDVYRYYKEELDFVQRDAAEGS